MKIIVAGGGTGGHITPNIAILELLLPRLKKPQLLYIGSRRGMEATLIPAKGWDFRAISCGKLRRYFSWENFFDVFRTLWGIWQSLWIIGSFRPDVIFCKGGYVSLPVAVAGGILRRPVIIHESDLEMGLSNRIAARFARTICVSFPETLHKWRGDKRVVLTGNPVRPELRSGDRERGYLFCDFKPNKKVLLVMGGSQGAQSINEMIRKNLDTLLLEYQVAHICGKNNLDEKCAREGYLQVEYLGNELKDVYAITDAVISRAGANSLAEIEALGLPAILIPLAQGSRGDQIKNAHSFAKTHRALVIADDCILDKNFYISKELAKLEKMDKILGKDGSRKKVDAAEKIVNLILDTAKNGQKI